MPQNVANLKLEVNKTKQDHTALKDHTTMLTNTLKEMHLASKQLVERVNALESMDSALLNIELDPQVQPQCT